MLDVLIRNAQVIDGTGAPCRRGSVGVRDGRILMDPDDTAADQVIDAEGLAVAPGFIDLHTHYDVQLMWDPLASPSAMHGVTTVFGGNCGFTLAPLRPETTDYLVRMMAVVEGMPLASVREAGDWSWRSFGEWLDRLEGGIAVNAGFLVGHSALRLAVMGEGAVGKQASPGQVEAMAKLLRDCLSAGGMGFSSTQKSVHLDAEGHNVPSYYATREELLALCRVLRDYPGTSLVFAAEGLGMKREPAEDIALMTAMSAAAGRSINWNTMRVKPDDPGFVEAQLAAWDYSTGHGGMIVGLTNPKPFRLRFSFASGMPLNGLPGWGPTFGLDLPDRKAALADPATRAHLREAEVLPLRESQRPLVDWAGYEIAEGPRTGRTIGEIAQGRDPFDVLLDLVVEDELKTQFLAPQADNSEAAWRERARVWLDSRTAVGGSDAGAHLDQMCGANYTTTLLGEQVRRRGLLSLEEAVRQLTSVPADLYGVKRRGRLADGWWADLVVFDPATVGPGQEHVRADLPGGGERLYSEPTGIEHVFVNGRAVIRSGKPTGAHSGRVLRSGRDTSNAPLS